MNKPAAAMAAGVLGMWLVVVLNYIPHFKLNDCISPKDNPDRIVRITGGGWGYYLTRDVTSGRKNTEFVPWRGQIEWAKQECPLTILPIKRKVKPDVGFIDR